MWNEIILKVFYEKNKNKKTLVIVARGWVHREHVSSTSTMVAESYIGV